MKKKINNIVRTAGLKFPVVGFNNMGGRGGLPFCIHFQMTKKDITRLTKIFFIYHTLKIASRFGYHYKIHLKLMGL